MIDEQTVSVATPIYHDAERVARSGARRFGLLLCINNPKGLLPLPTPSLLSKEGHYCPAVAFASVFAF